jgi:hypothetical protein
MEAQPSALGSAHLHKKQGPCRHVVIRDSDELFDRRFRDAAC